MFGKLARLLVVGVSLAAVPAYADWPWEKSHHAEDEADNVTVVTVWNNIGRSPPGMMIDVSGQQGPIVGFPWAYRTFVFNRGGVFHMSWPNPFGPGMKNINLGLNHNVYIENAGVRPDGLRLYDVNVQ